MKKIVGTLCLLLGSCTPQAEPKVEEHPQTEVSGERNDDERPDTVVPDVPDLPPVIVPDVDGFDWVDYGPDAIKIQFRIHNARECEMQSASILYGVDASNLVAAETEVYANGIIVATISGLSRDEAKRYFVVCEVVTPDMVYRTEHFLLTL